MSFPILSRCPLFEGIEPENIDALIGCLSATVRVFEKNAFIFSAGEAPRHAGVVLSGAVHVLQEDFWGNRVILSPIGPGGLFGEAFACAETEKLPVGAMAVERSVIMLIDCRKIFTTCSSACAFHMTLTRNMVRTLAQKNIALTGKMEHLTRRTTREKLLSYLSSLAAAEGRNSITLPFDRQGLADYLAVDRSALSRELSLMQREGLIRYRKNSFELLPDLSRSK
ncbi:Crp/Fnr family transcriptional regulator [Oscillospiraceae bacterium OttesenSCG-928-F05]|nr:Crp/Fnr family transcriptional regulator [Oscillospiraceae bacterium OttesenSCG-928-F05]